MQYELKLKAYSGPLDKLLELIEERKLEISEVSLSAVTDDFLNYLSSVRTAEPSMREPELRLLADFIVVASRLIFIKSKSLIPDLSLSDDEEGEIRDLETRLKLYQALKPAVKLLGARWASGERAWARPPAASIESLSRNAGIFYPGNRVTPVALLGALEKTFRSIESLIKERSVLREAVISLEEKIASIIGRVQAFVTTSFQALVRGENRSHLIASFLAVLHLAREQRIILSQENHLGDIIVTKRNS